jgi:hypothetical protein
MSNKWVRDLMQAIPEEEREEIRRVIYTPEILKEVRQLKAIKAGLLIRGGYPIVPG